MNPKDKKYILENIDKKSIKEMAAFLHLKERTIKRFLENENGKKANPAPIAPAAKPRLQTTIFSILLIMVMGFTVYANSLKGAFVYDDQIWVKENKSVTSWANLPQIFTSNMGAGSDRKYNFYRPLVTLTLMADYSLGKFDVRVYHLTNLAFHIGAGLCVYWLINILFNGNLLALLTALFFTVHPLQTEAVSYISGRSDPLYVFFLLLALIFYIKQPRPRIISFILVSSCYCLALLSKENAVILPFLVLLYHGFFRKFKFSNFLEILVITVIYAILRSTVLYFPMTSMTHSTVLERIPGFFVAVTNYIRLLVVPFHLHMEYGDFLFSMGNPKALLGLLILFSVVAYAFRSASANRVVSFGIAWFLLVLLPESNIYRINAYMYEHWLYLPSVGFFLVLAYYLSLAYNNKRFKILGLVLMAGLLLFYSCLTIKQNDYWKDPVNFYQRTLRYAPFSARLYNNLALLYSEAGRKTEAIGLFKKAVSINPEYAEAYNNLAVVYADVGKNNEAIESYRKALAINPNSSEIDLAGVYSNLGNAYGKAGKYKEAIAVFKKSIAMDPHLASAYNNLALVYQQMGNKQEAAAMLEKAAALDAQNSTIMFNLGNAYAALNKTQEAIEAYQRVTHLDGSNAAAYNNIGFLLKKTGKNSEALVFLNTALRLDPRLTVAYESLSAAYMDLGMKKEAAGVCLKALQADPSHAQVYNSILQRLNTLPAAGHPIATNS